MCPAALAGWLGPAAGLSGTLEHSMQRCPGRLAGAGAGAGWGGSRVHCIGAFWLDGCRSGRHRRTGLRWKDGWNWCRKWPRSCRGGGLVIVAQLCSHVCYCSAGRWQTQCLPVLLTLRVPAVPSPLVDALRLINGFSSFTFQLPFKPQLLLHPTPPGARVGKSV